MLKRCFLYPLFILLTTVELYISPRLCFAKPSCFHLIHQSCSSWMILPGLSCIYFRSSHLIWKFTTTHAVTLSGSFSYLAQGYSKFPVSAGNTSPVQLGWHVTACGCVFISLFPQVLAKQKLLAQGRNARYQILNERFLLLAAVDYHRITTTSLLIIICATIAVAYSLQCSTKYQQCLPIGKVQETL